MVTVVKFLQMEISITEDMLMENLMDKESIFGHQILLIIKIQTEIVFIKVDF
jgi:hypothetical protein